VDVNFVTLKIYDEKVQKEFDDHVQDAQFQKSTFVIYLIVNCVNVTTHTYGFIKGDEVTPLLVSALMGVAFTLIWYATNRFKRLKKYSPYFWLLYLLLIVILNVISIELKDSTSFRAKFHYQEPMISLTVIFFLHTHNLSYCQFK
jgi:hypothetical protein